MSPEVALFVAAAYLSIYILLCGIACGVALVRLFPRLSADPAKQTGWLTPKWEASNVFLVVGTVIAAAFFSNAFNIVGNMLAPLTIAIAVALTVRAAAFMFVYSKNPPLGRNVPNVIFAAASVSVPVALAGLGYYLFSGNNFWEYTSGWVVMAAAVTAIAAIGLVPTLSGYGSKQYRVLSGVVYLFALAPIALAWGNMPYLIYETITITEAYSAPAYGDLILGAAILALPVLGLGFPQIVRTSVVKTQ
jgi:cytochrome bd-type quinol oxidase subunit 2